MALTLYGIPNCGTVKKARAWLDERGVEHDFVNYREDPPDAQTVGAWVDALGAKAMRNSSGGAYRALPPEKKQWTDAQWKGQFAAEPMLIKRPLIVKDGAAVKAGFRGTDDQISEELGL